MLLNYLKLAIRLLVRNPFFTAINVIGIAIGFASFFALWSYSNSELKSNQYHKDSDRIARIGGYWRWTDDGKNWDYITFGFTKADLPIRIKEDFPEVEDYTRILTQQFFTKNIFPHDNSISLSTVGGSSEERVFKEDKVIYADQNLFEMFTIPLIHGEATNVLREAGSVVLSETMAKKYFDDINPTGELLKLNDTLTLNVTGVFQNLPHYTHFDFDMVMSNKAYLAKLQAQSFTAAQNFIKLRPGASLPDLERKINQKKKEYWAAVLSTKPNVDIDMFLQELHDIVFSKSFEGDEFTSRSKPVLLTFSIISFVILGMVWCNYLNLWLARNASREKEMATRKVNGASAKDFIFQFITESFIVNSIALLLALTLLQLMKTPLKTFFNIHISELSDIKPDTALIFLLSIFLSVGLTGIYPAMVALTRHPGALLRRSKVPETKCTLASVLAIIQYTSAVVVILWAFLIYLELNHILNGNLGLDRENVVVIEAPVKKGRAFAKQFDVYSNQLSSHQQVTHLSYGKFMPGDYIGAAKLMHRRGNTLDVGFDYNGVDERFIPFFGLKLVAGRNFIKDDRSDAVIISRSATQRLGFENPELAIGRSWKWTKALCKPSG